MESVTTRQALIGLFVAIIAISTGAILVRLSNAPSAVAAFYRVILTTLPLIPVAVWRYWEDFSQMHRRDIFGAILAGIALAIHFAVWFESLEWTSVAASVTLVQAQPIFVAVCAWLFLDDRMTPQIAAGIGLAIAGIIGISLGDLSSGIVGTRSMIGNTLALVGAVMMAGYVLAGRSLRQRVSLIPYVVISCW